MMIPLWGLCLLSSGCDDADEPPRGPEAPPMQAVGEVPIEPLVLGVWGEADAVWAVGGTSAGSWIGRSDGARMTPEPHPEGPTLWWIWGDGRGAMRASGAGGRVLAREGGGPWEAQDTGLDERAILWGIWGDSADDLWAVGGSYSAQGPRGVVLRATDGGPWRRLEDPALPTDLNLFKVWGSGPDDVHIVGEGGVALHWDGEAFTRVDVPDLELMFTVHGAPGGPTLAVGGRRQGKIWRWTGDAWAEEATAGLDGFGLNGVFVRRGGAAVAVGNGGTLLVRGEDGRWGTPATDLLGAGDLYTLHAAWWGEHIWAVGGALQRGADGVVLTSGPTPTLEEAP